MRAPVRERSEVEAGILAGYDEPHQPALAAQQDHLGRDADRDLGQPFLEVVHARDRLVGQADDEVALD